MSLKIEKKLTTKNCYQNKNHATFIVIHETDNTAKGADARKHAQALANGNLKTSVHYFVDDKVAVQTLDHRHGAWAVGKSYGTPLVKGVSNYNSINIEICVNNDGDYKKARENCIELVKILMKQTGISASKVIRHYDAKRKTCPRHMVENKALWDDFKKKIVEKNIDKEIVRDEFDMEKIVTYAGDVDAFAAIIVAQKNKCAVMKEKDFKESGIKAKKVIKIGGNKADTNRFETFKNAAKML